jgi:hypothetical protein
MKIKRLTEELGQNYTRPQDENHQDKPEEWLGGALVFARTIGLLLLENEGIVVKIAGDAQQIFPYEYAVVYNKNGNVNIQDAKIFQPVGEAVPLVEGQKLWVD